MEKEEKILTNFFFFFKKIKTYIDNAGYNNCSFQGYETGMNEFKAKRIEGLN